MKRLLYFAAITAAVVLVIFLGDRFRHRAALLNTPDTNVSVTPGIAPSFPVPPTTNPNTPPPAFSGKQPVLTEKERFGLVLQNPVAAYALSKDGVTAMQPDGQVLTVNARTGETTILSSTPIDRVISGSFSYDGKFLLASFGTLTAPQFSIFDVALKSWRPLSSQVEGTSWAPHAPQLVYFILRGGRNTLETLDVSNPKAQPKELLRLTTQDLVPFWVTPATIILSEKPSALIPGSMWKFDLTKKTLTRIVSGAPGLMSLWNSSGTRALIFENGAATNLTLLDGDGKALHGLSVFTLPSKCAFADRPLMAVSTTTTSTKRKPYLYCGIPRNDDELRRLPLPDEYLKRAVFSSDDFHGIDLESGVNELLFGEAPRNLDASKPTVFENKFYFVNRFDDKLYAITLLE